MKKILLPILLVFLLLIVAAGSFVFGANFQRDRFGAQLDEAQAMLSFNHLQRFREIEEDLSKNCTTEAIEKTRIAIDKELQLLSEFEKENTETWVNKYIADRDPDLLDQLKTFKSKYGKSWTELKCAK